MELSGSPVETVGALTSLVPRPLLRVRNLSVHVPAETTQEIRLVSQVTFDIQPGQVVALLGESGAGKTTLALALMCLLSPGYRVTGTIEFEGLDLTSLRQRDLRRLRGSRLSLIYQDSTVLNPVLSIGTQLMEILRAHMDLSRQECREKAIALLEEVELRDVDRIFAAFPHQLSGGQCQRVLIAQALACQPSLIIADEPTASLDPAVGGEILDLLGRLKRRFRTSILLISHDLAPITLLADRVMVMYAGKIVEQGPCEEVLQQPLHPYTRALLQCVLPLNTFHEAGFLSRRAPTIPGVSEPLQSDYGCDFECRCQDRMTICSVRVPQAIDLSAVHAVRCLKFGG